MGNFVNNLLGSLFFFLVQLRKLHCVWKYVSSYLYGSKCHWEFRSFKLCVVSKCVELFVLFNFMGYSMCGDMFHPTLVKNIFMKVRARCCKYWHCHKHDQWAHWKWNQNLLIPYDAYFIFDWMGNKYLITRLLMISWY